MTLFCFFFNDTATTEIYTLSLHDALPIYHRLGEDAGHEEVDVVGARSSDGAAEDVAEHQHEEHRLDEQERSEEHTSELQSRQYLVCRLLLEKKKKNI